MHPIFSEDDTHVLEPANEFGIFLLSFAEEGGQCEVWRVQLEQVEYKCIYVEGVQLVKKYF